MSISLNTFATGDLNYIGKHNANAAAIEAWVNSIEPQIQLIADKGQANGYASLDGGGQVPAAQIGDHLHAAYEEKGNKGIAYGYCPLGPDGRVPSEYMPMVPLDEAFLWMLRAKGYDLISFWPGSVPPGQAVSRMVMVRPVYFPAAFLGSIAHVHHASPVEHVFTIQREIVGTDPWIDWGTITFGANEVTGTFDSSLSEAELQLAVGDVMHVTLSAPLSVDADFYDLSITLLCSHSPIQH